MQETLPKEVEERIREACKETDENTKKLYDFLVGRLGKEAVSEIPLLSKEDQIQACLDHIIIGFEVGDIVKEDIEHIIST